jgi:septal ring factor EnvC (AmiA/AmiB activator)
MPDFPNFELSAAPFVLRNWCRMISDFSGRELLVADLRHIASLLEEQGTLSQQGQALDYHGQQITNLNQRLAAAEQKINSLDRALKATQGDLGALLKRVRTLEQNVGGIRILNNPHAD